VRPTTVGPVYTPWTYWYPVYRSGFGWNLGYVGFTPWGYAGFYGGRYGPWYYPYGPYGYYDPFYGPYFPYGNYGYAEREEDDRTSTKQDLGSLRIKASPSDAKVYVDGVLVGTVDDFNGFTNHLELEPGLHRLEFRAEGYETLAKDVTVTTSTTTLRLSLKKKK
jgi:hypothetical protein